jgi:hypothetical protein
MSELSEIEVLNPRQEIALLALLDGETQRGAAEAAGVSEGTVSRWMDSDHSFYRCYAQRRADIFQRYEARKVRMLDQAFATIEQLMLPEEYVGSAQYDPVVRLSAAKLVFQLNGLLPGGPRIFAPGSQVNIGDRQVNTHGNTTT